MEIKETSSPNLSPSPSFSPSPPTPATHTPLHPWGHNTNFLEGMSLFLRLLFSLQIIPRFRIWARKEGLSSDYLYPGMYERDLKKQRPFPPLHVIPHRFVSLKMEVGKFSKNGISSNITLCKILMTTILCP